jgi:hypothetical protein
MSIQSSVTPLGGVRYEPARSGDGIFTSLWKGLIRARESQARRVVSRYLANLSDQQLQDLGFDAGQIAATRRTSKIPASYWA